MNGEEPRYIPHPATWLNADRWEDEEPAAVAQETSFFVKPEADEDEFKAFLAAVAEGPWSKRGEAARASGQ
jgi:hypothetical protein